MILITPSDSLSYFSPASLVDLYHRLSFPQRAQISDIFLPEDADLPKINPPYASSIFPISSKHCISLLSYLLGYPNDETIDEPILGFLSIFSLEKSPLFMYNYSHFLVDVIHEQFMNVTTQGAFTQSSVIIHMILFQQANMLPIHFNKQDTQGVNQSVIHWK